MNILYMPTVGPNAQVGYFVRALLLYVLVESTVLWVNGTANASPRVTCCSHLALNYQAFNHTLLRTIREPIARDGKKRGCALSPQQTTTLERRCECQGVLTWYVLSPVEGMIAREHQSHNLDSSIPWSCITSLVLCTVSSLSFSLVPLNSACRPNRHRNSTQTALTGR